MLPAGHEALFPTESVYIGCCPCCGKLGSHLCSDCRFWHSPTWFGRAAALLTTCPRRFAGSSKDRAKERTHGAIRSSRPNAPDPQDILVLGMRAPTYRR